MNSSDLCLFALNASRAFGEAVAHHLGITLTPHEERGFEDGEHKSRPLANVRRKDVFVVQSLYGDGEQSVNDKLCRLLFFIGALKDGSASSVTAVVPYLGYARKDQKSKSRDPVTTRYVAGLFEAVGTDRVVTIDVHNLAAFQKSGIAPGRDLAQWFQFLTRVCREEELGRVHAGRREPEAFAGPFVDAVRVRYAVQAYR